MKNYYDELEVSKTASVEVIEKVYKVLAKKYHPDTTKEIDKQAAEEKFKAISEAYEILSDDEKRKKYDLELEQSNPTISYEEYINIINQRDSLNMTLNELKNELNEIRNSNSINNQYNNYTPYNRVDSDFTNTTYNNYQNMNQNYNNQGYSNQNTFSNKRTYYYTDTGKPASVFAYYKYKIKRFFSNVGLFILSVIFTILVLNTIFGLNILNIFI